MKRWTALLGAVALVCVALSEAQTNEPTAGTREFYEKKIKDRYILQNKAMVRAPDAPAVVAVSGTIDQVMEGIVVLNKEVTLPSGAVRKQPWAVVLVETTNGLAVGDGFVASNVAYKGQYASQTAAGMNLTLACYWKPKGEQPEGITFEQYMKVFEADHRPSDPVVRVAPFESYADRLRRRREERERQADAVSEVKITPEELEKQLKEYQMSLIRKGLPPLPIPLTKEMDNQLVAEGILPPQEEGKPTTNNPPPASVKPEGK